MGNCSQLPFFINYLPTYWEPLFLRRDCHARVTRSWGNAPQKRVIYNVQDARSHKFSQAATRRHFSVKKLSESAWWKILKHSIWFYFSSKTRQNTSYFYIEKWTFKKSCAKFVIERSEIRKKQHDFKSVHFECRIVLFYMIWEKSRL